MDSQQRNRILLGYAVILCALASAIIIVITVSSIPKNYCQIDYSYGIDESYAHFHINFNTSIMQPNFVVYNSTTGGNGCKDCRKFNPDPYGIDKITTEDYINTGYQRGHLVPNADYGRETFVIPNVVPMAPKFNMLYWLSIENMIRDKYNGKLVVKGCLFDSNKYVITKNLNKLYVPYGCYYTVLDEVIIDGYKHLEMLDYNYLDQETGMQTKMLPYWIKC